MAEGRVHCKRASAGRAARRPSEQSFPASGETRGVDSTTEGRRNPPPYPDPPRIAPYLPVQRGNVSLSNLQVLNAILYVAGHDCKWRGLPAHRQAPEGTHE